MELDIIIVTYNSASWIEGCLDSLSRVRYPKHNLNLFFVDNGSSDLTTEKLEQEMKRRQDVFGSMRIISNKRNVGFGAANNIGANAGKSEFIFFLNVDTEITEEALANASDVIERSDNDVAAWELRQFPYEHPKLYDPLTLSTSWISGAAFIIRRAVFQEVGGFDSSIFMYAEDVDLSWRIRAKGYRLLYMPSCIVYHYSYSEKNEIKPRQFIYSLINNLNLRVRYGSFLHVSFWHIKFLYILLRGNGAHVSRKKLTAAYLRNLFKVPSFFSWRLKKLKPTFAGWDYEVARTGGFYTNFIQVDYKPLVSILVRTIGRVDILREALTSIRNQTYKNIEVVVVEDGGRVSEKLIQEEFCDLHIVYLSTDQKVGRSKAANLAMDAAKGPFLNFLDDDDLLFPDHVEVLVNELSHRTHDVVYAVAFEVPTEYMADRRKINHEYKVVFNNGFNRLKLMYQNYLPIQCVMFKKELVKDKIYFDEKMDALEDWDFWMRLALETDFRAVDKTTSMYRVPYHSAQVQSRQQVLDSAIAYVREKQKKYYSRVNGYEVANDVMDLLGQNKLNSMKSKNKWLYYFYRAASKMLNKINHS
ncbi:glycosyltransferase family 2 protein [Paenibacillus kobensis]|uniref:glycosyltransferase family 2 protein n=1 Tax=Paenibacillus kobensis TaxID=59841 RepID=UPI0013E408EC|nr:glycosyltransferase family 2 protein [Paenibacillus kobensis]